MNDPLVALLGAAAAVAVGAAAILVVRLHLVPTGLDPVRFGVSGYALGPWRRLYQAQVIASGSSAILIAAALAIAGSGLPGSAGWQLGLGALVVYGLARVAIVRYPTDPPEREPTPAGRTHAILASIAFVALGLAAWRLGLGLADDPAWPSSGPLLAALSVAAPVATFATFAAGGTPGARPWFGAVERVFYAAGFGWLLVVALGAVLFGFG